MPIAILSDVHANLTALEAVLRHAEAQHALDEIWCLGDTVGYGPQPNEVLALLRRYSLRVVAGNHDLAAIGQLSTEEFNPAAAAAAQWTAGQLAPANREYLGALPQVLQEGEFTMVHGTLRWPVWEYLISYEAALAHLSLQTTPFSLVGHTHVPMLVTEDGQPLLGDSPSHEGCHLAYIEDGQTIALGEGQSRLVINPGGVGQPRDGDPRSAYAVYDPAARTVTLHRVEYDIAATQQKIIAAGLPRRLAERLSVGR